LAGSEASGYRAAMNEVTRMETVRVWDLPTRVFHWLLVAGVIGSIVSAKIGGNAMFWHTRLGLMALALLVFRIVWGLIGGHWSRFANFIYLPRDVVAYLRGDPGPGGRYDVGHSPLGALSVFALLAILIVQVATGLVADDEIATTGPLARFVDGALSLQATSWHKTFGQYLIIAMVLLHIGATLFYLFKKGRNLIAPMWHGDKQLPAATPASADGTGDRVKAVVLAVVVVALAVWIARLGG
jgi:cytochrome b